MDVISVYMGVQPDKYLQITGCGQVISSSPKIGLMHELIVEYLAVNTMCIFISSFLP